MEEVDEFGIPIKKQTSAPAKEEVDEFGIPIKKKVPTIPASSNGSSLTQPTSGSGVSQSPAYSVKVDEGPMRKGQPSTVKVGGKEFEVAPTPELTSTEVKSTANKLFKTASPITQTPKIPPSPAMEGVVKQTDEVAISNLSPKAASGNEDVLTEYISTLNEAEQNRLRGSKLNDEQSFEILTKAYAPRLEQAVIDLSILRDRGVENDLKAIDESQKQMQSLTQSISADKTALVDLQATFLKQKGYDKISAEYKNINKQLQVSQKQIAPILQEQQQIEAALKQFEPLIQNGSFVGSEQEYAAYQEAYNAYEQISNNPKLAAYNNLVQKQNDIASNINSMVTPEYKAQEEKLLNKINSSVASANTLVQNSQGLLTPEKAQNIELYKKTIDEYNAITNKLQTAKSKMPDVIEKEAYINAMNAAVKENPYLKAFDLSAKAIGGFTEAVGSMLSAVPKFAGGLSNEYTFSDKVAESITNFFAPAITNTQTTTAGRPSAAYQPFYDSETDHINWSSLPDEIANQAGAFAVLAGSGVLGGMAKFSEVSSVVVPGALISYNDAYQTGREIYGDDAYSATAYATASSLITGITELIMPDRDILTGGSVDKMARNYVANYVKKGKRFAIERSLVDLTEMMGKEVTEEFADRWKDVLLKGVVNITGGDIENDIPTLNEQLSIVASTAALTGGVGAFSQRGKNSKARQLAVYQSAKSYPETLTMLNTMEAEGYDADRIDTIKSEVTNMFVTLKEVPADLSAPKRIAIAEKLNTIKRIEDAMASGISPFIADKMNDSIKKISDDIQNIILDSKYDEAFGKEVNEEIVKSESAPAQVEMPVIEITPTTEEIIVEGEGQVGGEAKENTITDLNAKGKELFFEKPIRKEYQDGVEGDNKYAQDNIAHNKKVDDLILSINQNGTLADSNGIEYDVEVTSQGVRVSPKSQNDIKIYSKGKRVSGETPFTYGFKFTPTQEKVATETAVEPPAQSDAVKEDTTTTPTPTTDEKRNEEGRQKKLLTKEAEVATNIPEAPPLTKVFVATSGNTIEENEMGNLVVKGKRGGILTGKERGKAIREYRKEKMTGGKRVTSADLERDNITEPEAVRYIAENSTSPEQLLEMMAVVEPKDAKLSGKDSFIADNMDAISAESWAKFGDTNRITPDIKKNFIGKNGTGIDQIAQAASYAMNPEGDGTEITPKDVIDFVEANQKGIKEALKAGNEDMKVLYDAFVSLTGRAPTRSMIADVKKEGADKKIEEDFGMEPEPQVFSVSDSPQMKKRRFTKQVMADKATKGTTKAKITEDAIYYLEQKNEMSVGEANKILQDVGMDDAIAILKDVGNGINGGVRSVLGQVIIKELEATGRVDIAIDTLNWLTEKATDSGQFIQAFALWGYLTPAGQIRSAKRLIDEQRKDQFKKDNEKIKKAKRIIRTVQKEAIDETLANVGVEKKAGIRVNANTKRSSPSYGSKNKLITKEKYEKWKASRKGKLFSNPLDPELLPAALYHLEASGRKFADFAANLLDEFGSAVRPYIKDMYAAAKEELGGTGYDTVEDMDRVIAESQNEVWAERAKKITAKFDRALKTKSEKLFNEAVSELQSLPNKEELWEKYKNFAASRLKNLPAALFEKEAREKPALQNFTDELVRVFREKMQEAMPESESKSTPKKTRSSTEIIGDAFKNKEKYAEVWEEAQKQMREKFTEDELIEIDNYFGAILDTPFSQKQIERVVKDGLKSIDKKVADIARAHFTQYDATKQTLIDKLVNEADLDFMQAKELGDAISKEFDRIMASKKSEILERMFQEKVTTKKGKVKHNLETELEKLLNLGAFSDEAIMNMWADANGYPKLTEENYKELERLAAIVVATPDGMKKFKAIQDLLKYQATIKGVNWKEVGMAVWYANILSGYNTQLVNAVSTAINVMSNLMVTSVRTKLGKGDRRMAVKGLYDGFASGLLVAKDVLQTGYSPIFTGKVEMPSALEIKRFMGGKYNPANYLKFVRRVMVATDVIFFEAAKEMRAYQLAAKMARDEGKVDPDLDTKNRALAILNKTDFDQKKIIQEETIEYEHELDRINEMDVPAAMKEKLRKQALKGRSRRIFEITQQNRDLSIIEQSADFAARSTYNYPPEGALGALVKGINNWLNKLPFLRFFIPFTNIIANVANEQINYTPLGAVRAYKGGSITGNRATEMSDMDKADMYTKAAIGTTLMTLTYILAKGFGDDDEPILEITANGTGDYGKNYNLIKEGWQQYSFRFKKPDGTYTDWISYQYSPLQVGLSMIGNLMDFEKYRGEKADDETALKKLSLAFSASTRTFLDATFLSSLNDLLLIATNPFSEDAVSNFTKSLQNSAKSFVIPNLYTQGFKQVQASFDIPNKEVKETNLGWLLRDIPIAREMYNDQLDIFGNPVIPDTDKFFSGKDEDAPVYYEVAAGPLFNIKKPSIRTVKVEDPSTGEMTFLTPDEYYLFSKYRGEYLRDEIMKTVKAKKWDDFDKAYGTALQRDATYYAKDKIYDLRETYK